MIAKQEQTRSIGAKQWPIGKQSNNYKQTIRQSNKQSDIQKKAEKKVCNIDSTSEKRSNICEIYWVIKIYLSNSICKADKWVLNQIIFNRQKGSERSFAPKNKMKACTENLRDN